MKDTNYAGFFQILLSTHKMPESNPLTRRLKRERAARKEAEKLLEQKSLELFSRNEDLEKLAKSLEQQVQIRTREFETARDQAMASNIAKSAFLANVSHELRTPLTAIIGFANNVVAGITPADQVKDSLQTIVKNGQHLLVLLNDTLDLTKIDAGKMTLESRPFKLMSVFQQVKSSLAASTHETKKLDFSLSIEEDVPEIIISDQTRFKQILFNLGNNAYKFTEQGAITILISYNQSSNTLSVKFHDTGIGIPAEQLNRLFKPFSQVDETTTRKYGGTGMGLYISKKLANTMGGDITVSSRLGEGSTFELTISCGEWQNSKIDTEESTQAQEVDKVIIPQLRGSILVAEDVETNQQLIAEILNSTGVDYKIVNNGEKAVEAALSHHFDLILMDIQMPVMDGSQAFQMLKQLGYDRPVVALTANVMREDIQGYQADGFSGHLAKPIQLATFIKTLKTYIPISEFNQKNITGDRPFNKIRKTFLKNLPAQHTRLVDAIAAENKDECFIVVHSIKGAAGSVGFEDLGELADALELKIRQVPLSQLHTELQGFCSQLDSIIKQHLELA